MDEPTASGVRTGAAIGAAPSFEAETVPVFVDPSGRRSRRARLLGWLVATLCLTYLALIAVSMSGTSIGPLLALPPVHQKEIVFSGDDAPVTPGALEFPLPGPPRLPVAPTRTVYPPTPSVKAPVAGNAVR